MEAHFSEAKETKTGRKKKNPNQSETGNPKATCSYQTQILQNKDKILTL